MVRKKSDKPRLELMDFNENPNLGVYSRVNENLIFIRTQLPKKIKNKIREILDVKIVELSIADSSIIGSLLNINSKSAVVCDFIDKKSAKTIKKQDLNLYVIDDKINAAGNDILLNDHGALVHPDFKDKTIKKVEKFLEIPVKKGTIANLKTVGMAAVVTKKGILCHPKISDEEKKTLEDLFKVPVMIGTINHGSPVIGTGLIANSKGAIIGNRTTGIEMGRIEEALGFLD